MVRGNPKNPRIELESPILNEFLREITKDSSRNEHRIRLIGFERFVKKKYKTLVNNNFVLNQLVSERKKATGKKIYVYSFLTEFCEYLKKINPKISRTRIELCLHTVRQCLNWATDGLINNDVYKLKVKNLPNKVKNMKTRLDHEDIVELILAIGNNLRLHTLVMLLAGSGVRFMEAIRTQYKFIQWDAKPPCINLPAEVSKTGVERDVMLTGEMVKALKTWLEYKYRDRKIVRQNGDIDDYKKPTDIGESYIFKVREDYTMKNYRFIYKMFQDPFKDVVEKTNLGKKYPNGRNSVTLHSLRWFTQSTVERVTKRDVVAYYWIGKEQKAYQFEPNNKEELIELYNLVEPHLTFIDPKIINQNQQKQIDVQQKQIDVLSQQAIQQKKEFTIYKFEQKLQELHKEYVNDYVRSGKLKPIPADIPKEKIDKWLNDVNDPKLKLEELAIIIPQEVIEALEMDSLVSSEDLKILNEYVEENKPYVVLDLPNIAAAELGISVDEVRNRWKHHRTLNF